MTNVPDTAIIGVARQALGCFGPNLDRTTAAALLSMWRFSPELSERERTAILAGFPEAARYHTAGDVR